MLFLFKAKDTESFNDLLLERKSGQLHPGQISYMKSETRMRRNALLIVVLYLGSQTIAFAFRILSASTYMDYYVMACYTLLGVTYFVICGRLYFTMKYH